jgi:hypothetical protein
MSRFALALIIELLSLLAAQGAPPSSLEADKARAAVAVAVAIAALNDAKPVAIPEPMPAKPAGCGCDKCDCVKHPYERCDSPNCPANHNKSVKPAGCQCSECKCKDGDCPSRCPVASGVVVQPSVFDPYGFPSYEKFLESVKLGIGGVLSIGITDRWVGKYQTHYRVESGFGGFPDGEYDCWLQNGKPVMRLHPTSAPVQTYQPAPQYYYPAFQACTGLK